jgi:hypothetical protein
MIYENVLEDKKLCDMLIDIGLLLFDFNHAKPHSINEEELKSDIGDLIEFILRKY